MLQIFPFLAWLAIATSAAMLVFLWSTAELRGGSAVVVWGVFAVAGWLQFASRSALVSAIGLGLQTLLAVWLIIWWRLAAP